MPDNIHRVGVTGTRNGLTGPQYQVACELLSYITRSSEICPELHFGDCVGADSELYGLAHSMSYWTVAHPPTVGRYRAYREADGIRAPKPYLVRNRAIVDETDILLAFPKEASESRFGGTWHTVRYARKVGRRLVIVLPDGTETT
jgi:hypothetical protein